jgi:DNA primase
LEDALLKQINDQTSIVDLVSEFVTLQKAGKNFKGLCPFHQEKTPSFSVSPEKNIAKCMSCGVGGTPITFYKEIKSISFEEAAKELASRAGIEIGLKDSKKDPFEVIYRMMADTLKFYQFNLKHTNAGEIATDYILKRGYDQSTIEHFELGLSPSYGQSLYQLLQDKNYEVKDMLDYGLVRINEQGDYVDLFVDRLMFPIKDIQGHVVGFSGRTLKKEESVKYINSPESKLFKKGQLLYHLYEAIPHVRVSKNIVLMEGFFDCIAAYQSGIKHVVATMGTSLTKEHAALMKKITGHVVISYDGDQAGFKAADQACTILQKASLKTEVMMIPNQMDPDDYVKKNGHEAFYELYQTQRKDPYDFRYHYYRQGKSFKNTNDIQLFQKQITSMLKEAEPSIQSLYQTRLATDLNISVSDIVIPKSTSQTLPFEPANVVKTVKKDKYVLAEIMLIIAMMQSKDAISIIESSLQFKDYANKDLARLRMKLMSYYDQYESFDMSEFMTQLNSEETLTFESLVLQELLFLKKTVIELKELNTYIQVVKTAYLKRRFDHLNQKMLEDPDNKAIYVKERDQLKHQLEKEAS